MERTNRTYLLLFVITILCSYIISQEFETSLIISSIYIVFILLVNIIIIKSTEDDISLVNIRKIKYVKHPGSKRYFIYYDSNTKIKLYKSNLFYTEWISTYYLSGNTLDIDDLSENLLYDIDSDLNKDSETVSKLLNNWSGALTKEMERNDEINKILK